MVRKTSDTTEVSFDQFVYNEECMKLIYLTVSLCGQKIFVPHKGTLCVINGTVLA
jgi:hypothetical protein